MANMLLLVLTLALMSCAQSEDHYHYPRPQIPFHLTPQRPVQRPPPPTKFIVQTFGPHGRTYELQSHQAPAIYVAHQTHLVPGVQQQQRYHQQVPHQVQVQVQPQYQQQQHHQQQLQQFPPSSLYKNPLLVNTNTYPQTAPVGVAAPLPPPPAPNSYYVPPPPQPQAQVQLQVQAQAPLQQSADSYYRQPQALTVAQPTANYGPPQQQQQQQQLQQPHAHSSNPQPYAVVTLPHGQRVQDAGHGSGPSPSEPAVAPPRVGDYSAQSQSATLDTYNYKQTIPGDTRGYQRHVTNCQPNGQCQQLDLNPGQIDNDHNQLLQAARAQTQPAKGNCQKETYVPPGAQPNAQGQLRPKNRRAYGNVQEQVAKYPYN